MNKIILLTSILAFNNLFCQTLDTLVVSQNDTLIFSRMEIMSHQPCSNPRLMPHYELKNPKDKTYYLIYNEQKQLVQEGKYTSEYASEGVEYGAGFFNVKYYNYKKNGNLSGIHYQEDGRNVRTEIYARKNRLKEIRFIDKVSATPTKSEVYRNNKLKETRVYINYYANKYTTIKEGE